MDKARAKVRVRFWVMFRVKIGLELALGFG
jgi:hypothetical protein